jgi:dTDP-4-amino-4,6-dideoxygalactose transaminase
MIPGHLYGQTADMDAILELAYHYKWIVVEDACQAHGGERPVQPIRKSTSFWTAQNSAEA